MSIVNCSLNSNYGRIANNYTKPDDVDNDGIYEVLSNSTSVVASSKKDNSKWYKIYEDGRTPTEVTVSGGEKAKTNTSQIQVQRIIYLKIVIRIILQKMI